MTEAGLGYATTWLPL